jgi:hypothetical protein
MKKFFVLFLIFIFSGCSSYQVVNPVNPFSQYGIKKLAIPMFYNKSSVNGAAQLMTKEFYQAMSSIEGLTLVSGKDKSADAVLVGIVQSPGATNQLRETVVPSQLRQADQVTPNAVSGRRQFYVPTQSTINLRVRVFVVKRPNAKEIELLQTELGAKVNAQGKIVFNEEFVVSEVFDHDIRDGSSNSRNFTQTRGGRNKALTTLSRQAADNFKEMILYAF